MNRINLGPLATMSPTSRAEYDVESRTIRPKTSRYEHSIFIPLHYEKNYAYPLIVWLHDQGSDEGRLPQIMSALSLRNYVATGPRGSNTCSENGFGWSQRASSIEQADDAIGTAIDDACRQFNIAAQRIFIAGEGAGGTMAFRIAFQRPEWFAGVASINGPLPSGSAPLARLKACRQMPIFWTQVRHDSLFNEATLATQLRLLHFGGFNVTLRQYPADHAYQQILPDANRWLMDLVTKASPVSS
jgi:phospholipase/carboxylesterase